MSSKVQVRRGIWETNSSSTHTLAIFNKVVGEKYDIPETMTVDCSRGFGWEIETYSDPNSKLTYLFLAIGYCDNYIYNDDKFEKQKNSSLWKFIMAVLYAAGVKTIKLEIPKDSYDAGYIDHGGELSEWVHDITENTDLLFGYLFDPKSTVNTGNDNDGDEDPGDPNADYVYRKGN